MTIKPETAYTKIVKRRLAAQGAFVIKIDERYRSGFPDLIVVQDGVVKFVEIKMGDNQPTELQKLTLYLIAARGGNAYVLRKQSLTEELFQVQGGVSDFAVRIVPLSQLLDTGGKRDAAQGQ